MRASSAHLARHEFQVGTAEMGEQALEGILAPPAPLVSEFKEVAQPHTSGGPHAENGGIGLASEEIQPMELEGQVAIVTGAGRGIGRAIALELASLGAKVVVADLNQSTATSTAEAVEQSGRRAFPLRVDDAGSRSGSHGRPDQQSLRKDR